MKDAGEFETGQAILNEAAARIEQLEAALAAADVMAEQVTMAHGFTYEYGHRSLAEALTAYREARNQTGRPE